MSQATDHQQSDEYRELLAHLPVVSEASKSEARADRIFEDGSAITLTSREGAETVVEMRDAEQHEIDSLNPPAP